MPYATPLTDAELGEALASLPEWAREGALIRRSIKVADFRAAIALVNAVADAAEAANHHPDICISRYRTVSFVLTTHAGGALTQRDVDLAREIEQIQSGASRDSGRQAADGTEGRAR